MGAEMFQFEKRNMWKIEKLDRNTENISVKIYRFFLPIFHTNSSIFKRFIIPSLFRKIIGRKNLQIFNIVKKDGKTKYG